VSHTQSYFSWIFILLMFFQQPLPSIYTSEPRPEQLLSSHSIHRSFLTAVYSADPFLCPSILSSTAPVHTLKNTDSDSLFSAREKSMPYHEPSFCSDPQLQILYALTILLFCFCQENK